ncbi:MAG: hypothetical protein JWO42_4132, partial [Chloroflexi bacterium]|nr:hypothetical protein [Chloroflexota bacterium]
MRPANLADRDQVTPLLEAIRAINGNIRLPGLFGTVVKMSCSIADCDSATLYVRDNGVMRCAAVCEAGKEPQILAKSLPIIEHWQPLRHMLANFRPFLIEDTSANPTWADLVPCSPAEEPITTWLGVPLLHDERLLGFLGIGHNVRTEYDLDGPGYIEEF